MANNNHFNLTLDTLAPTGSITRPAAFMNANADMQITYSADATFMKVWVNGSETGSKEDQGYASAQWAAVAATKTTEFSSDGLYYYHMVLMDDVGNESVVYDTALMQYDTTRPTVSNAYMEDPDSESRIITNNLTGVKYGFQYADSNGGSGVVSAVVSGDDIDTINLTLVAANTSYEGTLSFKAGTQDGTKTISIVVTDRAGNESIAATASIILDTVLDQPVLALQDSQGTILPANINFRDIYVNLSSADTGVVGYKIWEGDSEPSEWTSYTPEHEGDPFDVTDQLALSSSEGSKTIHAKIKDGAGTVSAADDQTIFVDTVDPYVAISSDVSIISNVSGFDVATLTLAGTDVGGSGVAGYVLKCGNTTIDYGEVVPASFSLSSANSMVEGVNVITLVVTDNAGNDAEQSVNVTLDTTVPTASVGQLNQWYVEYFPITATYSNDVAHIYVWANNVEGDTAVPQNAQDIQPSGSPQTIGYGSIDWSVAQSSANYIHVKVIDAVGNVGYAHEQFGFDSVAPTKPTVAFEQGAYTSTSAVVTVQYSDVGGSGVAYMRITGDITNPTPNDSWETATSPRSVTLTSGDGYKSVTVTVKDVAGNVSAASDAATCELDTSVPTAGITLFEADGTTAKPSVSPIASMTARITAVELGDLIGGCEYKLYGDFTYDAQAAQGITETNANWTTWEADAGQQYMTIENMFCTSVDGVKTVYVKIKDSAGNISQEASVAFTYDTEGPEVVVSDIDYNRISKIHSLRRGGSGEIADKYCDETNFVFTPDEAIKAYKVCAYEDQAAALAGDPLVDEPIPNTAGSVNMSATGIASSAAVSCKIKGADFEAALGDIVEPGDNDGAHIVVVYVQDLAGTWSAIANFEA